MPKHPLSFTLGDEEAFFLMGLLQCPEIPGVGQDWLAGLGQKEIDAATLAAGRSLQARGFLQTTPEGQPAVDPVVVALVGGCAVPDVTFVATLDAEGREEGRYCHVQREADLLIEHSFPGPGLHTFANVPDRAELAERLGGALHLDAQPAPPCPAGRVREEALTRAREIAAGENSTPDRVAEALVEGGLPEETARALATAILQPAANGAFTRVDHHTDRVEGFATLEGPGGLWLLIPSPAEEDPWVQVEPASGARAAARLVEVCERD